MKSSLKYVVREPKTSSTNPPLLLMLHGYGSNELDLFSFADELQDELLIVSVRAPQSMAMRGFAWYTIHWDAADGKLSDIEEAKEALLKIDELVKELREVYQPKKFFMLGFSQGAILSYAYSLSFPNKVNYVLALSGYLNTEMVSGESSEDINTEYYASHGSMDQVLPVELARKTIPKIKELGLKIDYSEYPVGHGVAPQNFYHFKNWIEDRL